MREIVPEACLCIILLLPMLVSTIEAQPNSTNCRRRCGDTAVPYPFGIQGDSEDCYRPRFWITCNHTLRPPKPYREGYEITSLRWSGQLEILFPMAHNCKNSDFIYTDFDTNTPALPAGLFFSNTENEFVAIGCHTVALFNGVTKTTYTSGCLSICNDVHSVVDDGSCSGIGCCKASIPKGVHAYNVSFLNVNMTNTSESYGCSYSFLAKRNNYTFRKSDLKNMDVNRKFAVVLDWAITDGTCSPQAHGNSSYACVSDNSNCHNSSHAEGYLCNCSQGYQGNPYVKDGCQDVDECDTDSPGYVCKGDCVNTVGSYSCTCPPGSRGNATGDGCSPDNKGRGSLYLKLGIGLGVGLPFLLVCFSWTYWGFQKRNLVKLKQTFFRQNGGLVLRQYISNHQCNTFRIFTMAELEKATNNYDKNEILGKGGNGIVYKGVLNDKRLVAIKRSMMIDESKSREFAKEMLILSQINHVNVVKLLGCCLEVEVPMLVYEFIPNGTLYHCIHHKRHANPISWGARLKIAGEAAKALAYLHSEASPPILHGDVKSSNILLDENHTAKVSDFGTSTLAPKDKSRFMTLVQGTWGYLDPEYLQTSELTEKSDVYSFGVILAELLTGKKAILLDDNEKETNLVFQFKSCMEDNRLLEILDAQFVNDKGSLKQIQVVAELVVECLSLNGKDRPTMMEVSMELEGLRSQKHPWACCNAETEEIETLLGVAVPMDVEQSQA